MDFMVNYGTHVNYVDIQEDINLIYIYKYIMYKIFFPILISGIGLYYYYHFKYLNNKSNLNNNEDNYSDNDSINSIEEIIDNSDSNSEEIIDNSDSYSEEIIDNSDSYSENIIDNDEINNLNINKLEENTTLNDMQRYQIILYKEPFIIFNNWELIN